MIKRVVRLTALKVFVCALFFLIWISRGFSALTVPDVALAWDPSPDSSVVGYRLHSGMKSGFYTEHVDVGTPAFSAVTGLSKGGAYYFAVTAYNAEGIESDPSNEISFVVPGALRLGKSVSPLDPVRIEFPVESGRSYILQASGNLQTWRNLWQTVGETNGWIAFTDTNATMFTKRFYRLLMQ